MRIARATLPLFLLMIAATLRSQIQPCVPDCQSNPFQGPFYHQIIVGGPCGSCPINVEYYTRIACPGISNFQDFQITGVVAVAGNPCIACPIGPIIQEATLALIRDNPMGFAPIDPQDRGRCFSNWRVSAAPCWKGVQDGSTKPYPPFDRIEPCSALDCCWQQYEVCLLADGSKTVRSIGGGSTGVTCEISIFCTRVCEYLEFPTEKAIY